MTSLKIWGKLTYAERNYWRQTLHTTVLLRDFLLPPRRRRDLSYSGTLRSVEC